MSAFPEMQLRRPDGAGRINIGKEHRDRLFAVQLQANGDILLSPVVVRHEREAWLFDNPEALAMVRQGLQESARGETVSIDLSGYPVDDEE